MKAQRMLELHKLIRINSFKMLLKIMFLSVIFYYALNDFSLIFSFRWDHYRTQQCSCAFVGTKLAFVV